VPVFRYLVRDLRSNAILLEDSKIDVERWQTVTVGGRDGGRGRYFW